jgi:RNA polymerase sigma-70 factor (ECF subfamily)
MPSEARRIDWLARQRGTKKIFAAFRRNPENPARPRLDFRCGSRKDSAMGETSRSLLQVLQGEPDGDAWQRLCALYTPMIRMWLRQQAALGQDVDDLVQEVLLVVVRKLKDFERQRTGSFRRWLRLIAVNCLREQWRRRAGEPEARGDAAFARTLEQLEDPDSELSRRWDREHDEYVSRYLLAKIEPRFEPKTWRAFQATAVQGRAVADAAAELGMTPNAVMIAKSRVLSVLRQEGEGLLD